MKRYRVYTSWGAAFGIQTSQALPDLIAAIRKEGYLCAQSTYIMFGAIAGIEDEEMTDAVKEASEQESWQ